MTKEELKQQIPMVEILQRYSPKIKGNMCSCPFHVDKNPSMKIFKDGAKCFSCGWSGDIFKMVMDMDRCDFKTAFITLGGTYEHIDSERVRNVRISAYKAMKAKEERTKKAHWDLFKTLTKAMDVCREVIKVYEPYSDGWCYAVNKLPLLENAYETKFIYDKRIDELDVYRISRAINKRFL